MAFYLQLLVLLTVTIRLVLISNNIALTSSNTLCRSRHELLTVLDKTRGGYNRSSRLAVRPAKIYLTWLPPAALLCLHRLPVQKRPVQNRSPTPAPLGWTTKCRSRRGFRPVQKTKRASVEEVSLVYTGTLVYTGSPGVDDKVPVQRYDYTLPKRAPQNKPRSKYVSYL